MSRNSTPYDDDILLWSEQQAAAIRKLQKTARDVPNELDVENVAEEIESVGRSELAAVKSHIRLIFLHLIKLCIEAGAQTESHWRGEIAGFHSELVDRYAPSMRQRIDVDGLWRSAVEQSRLAYNDEQLIAALPAHCPFKLDDLIAERIDIFRLRQHLRSSMTGRD